MSETERQLQALRAEREILISELTALRLQTQPVPVPALLHPTARYSGGKNLFEFIHQMKVMLCRYHHTFNSDAARIDYISLHLVDAALSWFTAISNIQDPRVGGSLEEFFEALRQQYGGIDPQHQANLAIDNLRQGNRSANSYIAYFLQLSAQSTYSNDALVNALRRGLNQAHAERVALSPNTYNIHTLQRQILQAEQILQQFTIVHKQCSRPPSEQSPIKGFENLSPRRVVEPEEMEVDIANSSNPREAERARRRSLRLCYYCGSSEHFVSSCPTRPSFGQQRNFQGSQQIAPVTVKAGLKVGKVVVFGIALIGSGASHMFIDQEFCSLHQIPLTKLPTPIDLSLLDSRPSTDGSIKFKVQDVDLTVQDQTRKCDFYQTRIQGYDLVLGMSWF